MSEPAQSPSALLPKSHSKGCIHCREPCSNRLGNLSLLHGYCKVAYLAKQAATRAEKRAAVAAAADAAAASGSAPMEVDLPSSVLAASSGSLVGTHGVPASMDVGSAGATVAQQAGYPAAAAASGASAQPDDLSTLDSKLAAMSLDAEPRAFDFAAATPADKDVLNTLTLIDSLDKVRGTHTNFTSHGDKTKRSQAALTGQTGSKDVQVWSKASQQLTQRTEIAEHLVDPMVQQVTVGYLWDVPAPAAVSAALGRTRMGALYGPNGICGVQQYLPGHDLKEGIKLFFAPPAPGMVLAPPHADGEGYKSAMHFVLSGDRRAYNTVQIWKPKQLGIDDYEEKGPHFWHGEALEQWRKLVRITEKGGSENRDAEPWQHGVLETAFPSSTLRLGAGQVLLMMPGDVHFFLKCFDVDVKDPHLKSTLLRIEPLVGAACDIYPLGHSPELVKRHLHMFAQHAAIVRQHTLDGKPKLKDNQVLNYLFPLPLLFATLAFGEKLHDGGSMDAALQAEPFRALHFHAAVPYCEKLLSDDEEIAKRLRLKAAPVEDRSTDELRRCSLCEQHIFNLAIFNADQQRCCVECASRIGFRHVRGTVAKELTEARTRFGRRMAEVNEHSPPNAAADNSARSASSSAASASASSR